MIFRLFSALIFIFSSSLFASGRGPAVEEFIGVDIEESKVTPRGDEALFNLEQDIHKIEEVKIQSKSSHQLAKNNTSLENPSKTFLWGVILGLGLPLSLWLMIMSRLKKKASIESASNLEILENYRKAKEMNNTSEHKKVS